MLRVLVQLQQHKEKAVGNNGEVEEKFNGVCVNAMVGRTVYFSL